MPAIPGLSRRRLGQSALFAIATLLWLYTNMFTEVIWFETSIPSMVALLVMCRLAYRETSPELAGARERDG